MKEKSLGVLQFRDERHFVTRTFKIVDFDVVKLS